MNEYILGEIYKALTALLTTVLIPAIVAVAFTLIKNELAKGKLLKNELVRQAVTEAVKTVEQLYQAGKLKGIEQASQDKFDEALEIAEMLLAERGVKVELHELGSRIEAAVFTEINSQIIPFLAETNPAEAPKP